MSPAASQQLFRRDFAVFEPIESRMASHRVDADHPPEHSTSHFSREEPTIELGQHLRQTIFVVVAERNDVGGPEAAIHGLKEQDPGETRE